MNIPDGAQFYSGYFRSYYKIEGIAVCVYQGDAWVTTDMSLQQFEELRALRGFAFTKLDETPIHKSLLATVDAQAWCAQFVDDAVVFGGIDAQGNHPVRVDVWQAYRFADEAECRAYCTGKERLLVPCFVKFTASVK